jgi:peptide/nickel transport system permease protein
LVLSLITLWLLATIVFVIANVLPNDVGRAILGPFAPQATVDALNERLGTNDPILEQYARSMTNLVTFNFGESFQSRQQVLPLILGAVGRSGLLAIFALLLTIPIAIAAGLFAARRRDRRADRTIVLLGVTLSSIPEFVVGTFLVVVIGVQLRWFPVTARPPDGADPITILSHLFMPALAMAVVYFGYIARMSRAGTIEVLESDYVRTATMKGLTTGQTMRRHVLRNALVPTVAVIGVQIGYLFGGIIGVEKVFNYNGMGQVMLFAAQRKDIPVLTAGAIIIGIVYMLATLAADLIIAWMNPRSRLDTRT